ncbi:hypothetical protein WJX74_004451 [Apatococcus lobatus]|uniref:Cytochrome b561 domain-containing protein n=2 Tax=Apatococcus TaxID=904362 RepID=A0AAW1TJN1_9CHLO
MARSLPARRQTVLSVFTIGLLGCNIKTAQGADVVVGGADGWEDGIKYNPLQAQVGDVLVFNYRSGAHNVIQIPTLSCSALSSSSANTLAARQAPTPVRIPVNQTGVFNYACSVGDHCDAGQLIQITVSGGSVISSPTAPAPAPAAAATEAAVPTPATGTSPGGGTTTPAAVAGGAGAATAAGAATSPPAASGTGSGAAASTSQSSQQSYYRKYSYLKHIHAWLMGTAFIFVMPLAIIIARGYRSSGKVWLHLHWILQAIATILVVSGVVLGHYFNIATNLQKAHRVVGIIAVALLGLQVLVAAALRPAATKWIRKVWNVGHWNLGKIVLAMGIVNFYIGIHLVADDLEATATHIYIAAAVILGFFLLLAVLKDAYDHITKPQPSLANIPSRDGPAYARQNGTEDGFTKPHADADLMNSQAGLNQAI